MARVHANPVDLEELDHLLFRSAATIEDVRRGVRNFLERLSEDWRDAEYDAFVQAFDQAEQSLGSFIESSELYRRYLRTLIEHLEKYLSTNVPSLDAIRHTSGNSASTVDGHDDRLRREVEAAVRTIQPIVKRLIGTWESLTPSQRLDGLECIQVKLAQSQSRPGVPLRTELLAPGDHGSF